MALGHRDWSGKCASHKFKQRFILNFQSIVSWFHDTNYERTPSKMFSALHHFNLIVSDREKTKAFYNGVLGLEIALETEIDDDEFSRGVGLPGTKVLAAFFKLPGSNGLIETFQYVNPEGRPIPSDAKANDGGLAASVLFRR